MNRRAFIAVLGSAAPWALLARAQQRWHIGLLSAGSSNTLTDVIISTLQELGYVDGRNIVIERRFAEGHLDRLTDFATELVNLHVDIIVTLSTPAGIAAKKAHQFNPDCSCCEQ
jgi:putative tryptophan/tyrosine transport system substrate-binding protein